jgi:hypothetical protein
MSGGISGPNFNSNAAETVAGIQNSPQHGMDTAGAYETVHVEPAKKSHDRDWRELRQRLERKIAAAAVAMNGKQELGKPRWLGSPQAKKETRSFTVNSEDKITVRAANPRTGVISPSNHTDSSQEDTARRQAYHPKWKMKDDQWVTVDVSRSSSSQTSSSGSKASMGSQEQQSSPIDMSNDWEDRFVVNMPSAKEPNPPTMSPQQIQEYQEIVRRARREREQMQEASSEPNQHVIPPDASPPMLPYSATLSPRVDREPSVSPPAGIGKYFSPDEVGIARVSPIQEGSQQKPKKLYYRDECFLGCMEIDRPCAKNPDEILLFPGSEDDCQYSPLPSTPTSRKVGKGVRPKRLSEEEKAVVHESIPASLTPRAPLSSGQRVASAPQKSNVQESLAQRARKLAMPSLTSLNGNPRSASGKENLVEEVNRTGDDDVIFVTPTITRVMIPPTSIPKSMTEPSRLRQMQRPAGPSHATPARPAYMSPDLFLRDKTATKQGTNVQGPSGNSAIPRYTHMPATAARKENATSKQFTIITNSYAEPAPKNGGLKLDTHNVFKDVPAAAGPTLSAIVSPAEERARNTFRARRGKPPSVAELDGAELDGLQVRQESVSGRSPEESPERDRGERENIVGSGSPGKQSIKVDVKRATQSDMAKLAEKRAEAKKAAERLVEARKHAERLAEARAAYKRAEAEKAAEERLKQRKKAAEKLAEAQAAYREARAKKAEEKNTPAKGASERKKTAGRKTDGKSAEKGPQKPKAQNTTDETKGKATDGISGLSLQNCSLLFHIVLLSFAQLHGFLRCNWMFHQVVLICEKLFDMASHCIRVSKRLCDTWVEYRRTGSFPSSSSEELALLMRDVGQAGIYFVVLGFVVMVVGRAAGYIVLLAGWIVWFSRPFGWVFGWVGGCLFS